jgi:RNA polymerase sigma-70 factor (ECF subfamily)
MEPSIAFRRAAVGTKRGATKNSADSRDDRHARGVISRQMMEFDEQFSVGMLLAQSAGMRNLALTLLADAASGDDMVQQTVASRTRHSKLPDAFVRPWLKRVILDFAPSNWRNGARRRERESSTAKSDAQRADDAAATLEMHGMIIGAIKSLKSAHQAVIVQHYFRGKSLPDIASERGLPESTAVDRMKCAVEDLGATLDRTHGREKWVVLFLAFARRVKP